MKRAWLAGLALASSWAGSGCGGNDCCKLADANRGIDGMLPDAGLPLPEVARVSASVNRDIDVLFVIDDSPSMLDKQNNLVANFPVLINILNTVVGGLPNLHIGVVTTDLGTKGADDAVAGPMIGSGPGSCSGNGKAGNLQTNGTTLVTGTFISDIGNTDGTRTTNYTGSLASAFVAIASVGQSGCGFEQPIEAAKRALNNNPANAGFLRPNARLAIVVLSDEDDCSLAHSALLGTDTTTLGPLQSFRCTRFGIQCDVGGSTSDAMNAVDTKDQCHSNESVQYLTDLARYTSFFPALKTYPSDLAFTAIMGDPTPFAVELRAPPGGGTAIPALAHSCSYTDSMNNLEVADPGVRIAQMAAELSGTTTSICTQDLSAAMTSAGYAIKNLIGDGCLTQPIAQPPSCVAVDVHPDTTQLQLPLCGATTTNCMSLISDPTACPAGQNLRVQINRSTPPPAGTYTSVSCAL